jgi:hypothetical protein
MALWVKQCCGAGAAKSCNNLVDRFENDLDRIEK